MLRPAYSNDMWDNCGADSAFRLETQLGSGGSGVVYKAWHYRLRKHVAVKVVKHNVHGDIKTCRNETEALRNLRSAYLPQILGYQIDGDYGYTVMEFIEGESLDKLLERGQKFTERQAIKWYAQLAVALETIHGRNICHRDIKPAIIILTPDGDVCLIDFTAALIDGKNTRVISRSPGYASPEQHEYFEKIDNARLKPTRQNNLSTSECNADNAETQLLERGNTTESTVSISRLRGCCCAEAYESSMFHAASGAIIADPGITAPVTDIDWKLSDIYSLGATMYHVLMGKRPPGTAGYVGDISKLAGFRTDISEIIKRSMRRQPAERYQSASELAEAIILIYTREYRRAFT